jgi:hypothetical protein
MILGPNDWLIDFGEMFTVIMYGIGRNILDRHPERKGMKIEEYKQALAQFVTWPLQGMMCAMKGLRIDYMPFIERMDGHLKMKEKVCHEEYEKRWGKLMVR